MSFKCNLGQSRDCPAYMSGSNCFLFTPTWVTVYVPLDVSHSLTPTWTCAIIMVITYHPQLHHHQRIANRINFANHLQMMNAPPILFFIHEDCKQRSNNWHGFGQPRVLIRPKIVVSRKSVVVYTVSTHQMKLTSVSFIVLSGQHYQVGALLKCCRQYKSAQTTVAEKKMSTAPLTSTKLALFLLQLQCQHNSHRPYIFFATLQCIWRAGVVDAHHELQQVLNESREQCFQKAPGKFIAELHVSI